MSEPMCTTGNSNELFNLIAAVIDEYVEAYPDTSIETIYAAVSRAGQLYHPADESGSDLPDDETPD